MQERSLAENDESLKMGTHLFLFNTQQIVCKLSDIFAYHNVNRFIYAMNIKIIEIQYAEKSLLSNSKLL